MSREAQIHTSLKTQTNKYKDKNKDIGLRKGVAATHYPGHSFFILHLYRKAPCKATHQSKWGPLITKGVDKTKDRAEQVWEARGYSKGALCR